VKGVVNLGEGGEKTTGGKKNPNVQGLDDDSAWAHCWNETPNKGKGWQVKEGGNLGKSSLEGKKWS